jgi:hypothetical protein
MEPIVELEVPDAVPADDNQPFNLRGLGQLQEEMVRAHGFRERLLEENRITRAGLDQETAVVREWFADRGLNLGHPVVAATVLVTLALTRGRPIPGARQQMATAAIEAIDRMHETNEVPPSERQLRLFE